MDLVYYYWLTTVEGLNNKKISHIKEHFGNLKNAWQAKAHEFTEISGITPSLADKIVARRSNNDLLAEISGIKSNNIDIITIDEEKYPERLKNIYDPPLILYVKGKLSKHSGYLGVVGSRKCTSYGKVVARSLSKLLIEYGLCIISGLARGIDTEAHLGALNAEGVTWAVLGCGCDIVYPPENKKVMDEIVEKGAIISEYPPGTKPFPSNFPARNRIISGLSDGLLVVEADEKSGALITANFSLEYGREVYAVPGSILSDMSRGTNKLIKDGARPVTDVTDILYGFGINFELKADNNTKFQLSTSEKVIMNIINNSPIYLEDLIQKASLKVSEINSILTSLEIKGAIKILPGKFIVRTF